MTDYRPKYVSFDCYGTLINYEIDAATRKVVRGQISDEDFPAFRRSFSKYRYDQVLGDYYPYRQVLQDAYDRTCGKWRIESDPTAGEQFADAVLSWGAHPDVPGPLAKMAEKYPLVILSNADTSFLDVSVPRLGAPFHAVFTAEQAGFYKPRYQAFEYMVDQLDATPDDFLHVSSHTRYDLMPAHDLGFRNLVMLNRDYDPPAHSYGYVDVSSLDELNQMLGID
ncbi:haloacid dehalogenase type II [Nocardioides maradonensis]